MAVATGSTHFFLKAGQTLNIDTEFNGDAQNGGDYVGPIVPIAVPDALHQAMDISTVSLEFLSRNSDGLTSQCIYHYSITNNNSFGMSARLDKFYDG